MSLLFSTEAFRIFYGQLNGEGSTTSQFPVERFFRRLLYIMMPAKIHTSIEMLYALDGL